MGETLTYAPHKAINSQALADFVAEWTNTQLPPAQVQAEPSNALRMRSLVLFASALCLALPAMVSDADARGLHDKAAGTVIVRAF